MLDALDEFSMSMAKAGALLIHYRAHFIKRLCQGAPAIHGDFSGDRERLTLRYETVSTVTDPEAGPQVIFQQLLQHQEEHRAAEIASRQCLSGPHKDDLLVEIDEKAAKSYASQGQTRTAALSLKLAAREIFQQDTGEYPVLLLDDVLSELDPRRQEFVLNRIRAGRYSSPAARMTGCRSCWEEGSSMSKMALCGDEYRDGAQRTEPRVSAF